MSVRYGIIGMQEFFGTILLFLWFYPTSQAGYSWKVVWLLQGCFIPLLDWATAGAGFNPAITLAFWLSGMIPTKEAVVRTISCVAGSLVALHVVNMALPSTLGGVPLNLGEPDQTLWKDIFAQEMGATAFLTLAIFYMEAFRNKGIWFLAIVFRFIQYFWKDPCMNPVITLAYYSYTFGLHTLDNATVRFLMVVYFLGPALGASAVTLTVKYVTDSSKSQQQQRQQQHVREKEE
jgi:glycerol uptake facilitator-like aquaporin